jgi:two-component system sensor histidine kinase/response regulator
MISPLHVLVVEDNPINQQVARRLLEKAGHTVSVAGNGVEAVHRVAAGSFDLVLMDVQMPGMDGLTATEAIRAGERATGRRVPIVALTALARQGDQERCLEAGMDGYVTKPFAPAVLFAAMAEVLAGRVAEVRGDDGLCSGGSSP